MVCVHWLSESLQPWLTSCRLHVIKIILKKRKSTEVRGVMEQEHRLPGLAALCAVQESSSWWSNQNRGLSPLCHSPGVRATFLTQDASATRKPWDFELSIPQ